MKDAKGHGSDGNGGNRAVPIKGHAFHMKPTAQLQFISRDASAAAKAMQGHNPQAEAKYLDQMNDAQTILSYRSRGGKNFSAAHQSGVDAARDTPSGALAPGGRHGYNPTAVNQAIASSNRAGRRIGGNEASAIHRLLRGR
jgi:hypothetical protein